MSKYGYNRDEVKAKMARFDEVVLRAVLIVIWSLALAVVITMR